jgi:uncharacterized protein (UPF0332 family)
MFDWGDFLAQAQRLSSDAEEAGHRSAVSRAYYAVFGLARGRLQDSEGLPIPATGRAHRIVWEKFNASSDVIRQRIGITGNRLRHARNRADYDNIITDVATLSQTSLADAQLVADLLRSL